MLKRELDAFTVQLDPWPNRHSESASTLGSASLLANTTMTSPPLVQWTVTEGEQEQVLVCKDNKQHRTKACTIV